MKFMNELLQKGMKSVSGEESAVHGSGLRILIIRLSALGDIVHTLPLSRLIRRYLPGASIHWLVQDRLAPILENESSIDRVIPISRKDLGANPVSTLRALRRTLKDNGYTHSIDVQGLAKSSVMSFISGAAVRLGFNWSNSKEGSCFLNNRLVANDYFGEHVVAMNLCLATGIGLCPEPEDLCRSHQKTPWINPGSFAIESALGMVRAIPGLENFEMQTSLRWPSAGGVAVISPGAGWPTKIWPTCCYGELARWLIRDRGMNVAIIWAGDREREMALKIGEFSGAHVLPETDLLTMSAILGMADLFVGGDTGPMHIANFQGTPCAAIHLASDSRRNGPWFGGSLVITPELNCHPCMKRSCDTESCLNSVDSRKVIRAINGRFFPGEYI
jgi:lipopolysaccharide heptosyltransferase I